MASQPTEGKPIMQRQNTVEHESNRIVVFPATQEQSFMGNSIDTAKYNALTFLPKNLWEQFHKLSNVYFICVAVLQCIPEISVSGGIPNILLPLLFVLIVSAVKDAMEDNKRRQSDNAENNSRCLVYINEQFISTLWKDIKVGDIVKIVKNEYFPADLILLASSDENGISYIETKSLDGETNLKHKLCRIESQERLSEDLECLKSFRFKAKVEDPHPNIYQFSGAIDIGGPDMYVTTDQFLYRGSSLKNTDFAIGIVTYTGHETKVMLNSTKARQKFSKVEQLMNRQIIYVFLVQCVLCLFCAIFYTAWFTDEEENTEYYLNLSGSGSAGLAFVVTFFKWMLLFVNFVPISLIVTLETVKFLQAKFIAVDLDMYHEENDMRTVVQTSNLNEELGQIAYIFSDKTGTLTQNVMEFKKLSVWGKIYGQDSHMAKEEKIENCDFVDPEFLKLAKDKKITDFIMALACCHTIIPFPKEDGSVDYMASSPDDLALARAAGYFGIEFRARDYAHLKLKYFGEKKKIKILKTIEFSSKRKRMSTIIQIDEETVRVICKGADEKLRNKRMNLNDETEMAVGHLKAFANEGLRTLMISQKEISLSEYMEWESKWDKANFGQEKDEVVLSKLRKQMETNLEYLGCTAIEDKLQDQVPETIECLRNAGVIVWVLTGDKIETAISIGFSCKLLTNEMTNIIVDEERTDQIANKLQAALEDMEKHPDSVFALVVSGPSLIKIMNPNSPDQQEKFLKLADGCKAVLACRVSPKQKADIVNFMRAAKPTARTLSIGDGANDVNMITAAHVGVGISGLEGQQASRASDYAIAQFSFLQKLLFVYGRESYRKNSNLICYNFYKNVLLVLPMFWYGSLSVFAGGIIYNNWSYQFFNVVFTSFPIIFYALFDKETEHSILFSSPSSYEPGLKNAYFGTGIFWLWIIEAALQSCGITFVAFHAVCQWSGDADEGRTENMFVGGTLALFLVVIIANLKIVLFSYSHYWFSTLVLSVSVLIFPLWEITITSWMPVAVFLENYESRNAIANMFANPMAWFALIFMIFTCVMHTPVKKLVEDYMKTFNLCTS